MLESVKEWVIAELRKNQSLEGLVTWMYLDTREPPVVTTGVGHAMFTEEDCVKLPWSKPSAIVRSDYHAIKSCMLRNRKAESFAKYTSSRLELDFVRGPLLELDGYREFNRLETSFPEVDDMPEVVQKALGHMAFNRGGYFLKVSVCKCPRFRAALLARNWDVAATEGRSSSISSYRNDYLQALIRMAISTEVAHA